MNEPAPRAIRTVTWRTWTFSGTPAGGRGVRIAADPDPRPRAEVLVLSPRPKSEILE